MNSSYSPPQYPRSPSSSSSANLFQRGSIDKFRMIPGMLSNRRAAPNPIMMKAG